MQLLGATVVPVESGTRTLKDATNEALRDWVTNVPTTHYIIGSVVGPDPYPADGPRLPVGDRPRGPGADAGALRPAARTPWWRASAAAPTRWASSPASSTIPAVRLVGVEAAGEGIPSGHHSATLSAGAPGRAARQPELPAAGRGRPGRAGPLGVRRARLPRRRARSTAICATPGGWSTSRPPTPRRSTRSRRCAGSKGIIPALETAHALRLRAPDGRALAARTRSVLVCLSGRGDKDVAHVAALLGSARVTSGPVPTDILPASQVAELINGLVKALRAYHMYLPNNPDLPARERQPPVAFQPIWAVLDELVLTVAETDFVWEEQVVYHQLNKAESIAWGLFKDGMRSLTIRRGAELEELPRFLETINRARFLPADAGDDLLTLLWEQEFEFIQYQFMEFYGDGGGGLPEQTGSYTGGGARRGGGGARPPRRGRGGGAAPAQGRRRPRGVRLDALLPGRARDQPGGRSGRGGIQPRRARVGAQRPVRSVRAPGASRRIRSRDSRHPRGAVSQSPQRPRLPDGGHRAPRDARARRSGSRASTPSTSRGWTASSAKLSEPAIVSQLIQSIDEAPAIAGEATVAEVLQRAARDGAGADPHLDPDARRRRRSRSCSRASPTGWRKRTRARCSGSCARPTRRRSRRWSPSAAASSSRRPSRDWARRSTHPDPAVRLASVQALAQLGTPAALGFVEKALEDADRAVRLAAVRVVGRPRLQGRAAAGRGRRAREAGGRDGPHREDGVLRGLRRHRGRGRAQAAERAAAAARACSG